MSALGGSLWLVPDPSSDCAASLKRTIKELADGDSWGVDVARAFEPHMTITSGITDYFLSSVAKVDFPGYGFLHIDEVKLTPPELKVKEVVFGDLFFKRIYLRLERTETLLHLVSTLRSQFVGESQNALDDFMLDFDPHISLAYADGFSNASHAQIKQSLEDLVAKLDLSAFKFIVLMDTRSPSSRQRRDLVSDWKASPIRLSI